MRRILLLLAVLSCAFAPAPLPRPDKRTDLQQLQGEWVIVSSVLEGATMRLNPGQESVVFKGDQLSFLRDGTVTKRWTVVLDASRKPRTMDLRDQDPTIFILAIYRLDGDTLTLCNRNNQGGKDRPAEFTGRKGVWLTVSRRSKR